MSDTNTYDAIVVGSGMSGGWAAKELCEKGLKTLVLERGVQLRHIEDYKTALKNPWELPYNNRAATNADRAAQPIQSTLYLYDQSFFKILKDYTLSGYFLSEIGATQALAYEQVPGGYWGDLPLQPNQKAWAI